MKFIDKALSNVELIRLAEALNIRYQFKGVYSRDTPLKKIGEECGIIYLVTHIGEGTHWVCYRNIDEYCEYFDSFGLPMAEELKSLNGKQIIYSLDEIQERNSVLCGYWCLYFLNHRNEIEEYHSLM